MRILRFILLLLAGLAIAASAGYVGFVVGRETAPARQESEKGEEHAATATSAVATAPAEHEGPVAKVKTAAAEMAQISKTITAFGTVVTAPEDTQVVAVPFESRVKKIHVLTGQPVTPGAVLVEVEPSPEAALALQEARNAKESTAKDLAQAQQRLEMKLATRQELLTAQQAVQSAQVKLESLEKRGIGDKKLQSDLTGLVSKIDVQEGQIVPAGGPLVELVPEKGIQARLGADPADIASLHADQAVRLYTVQGDKDKAVEGHIHLIARRVNPATRLVDVLVSLPKGSPLLLEAFVRGLIVVETKQALVVPRSAVLPEEEEQVLFTIHDGKAVEHKVKTGLEDEEHVEILGDEIKPGEQVVIQGNYELKEGMAVEVEKPEAEKAQTQKGGKSETSAAQTKEKEEHGQDAHATSEKTP